jgi:hypothetical protein
MNTDEIGVELILERAYREGSDVNIILTNGKKHEGNIGARPGGGKCYVCILSSKVGGSVIAEEIAVDIEDIKSVELIS